MQEVDESHVPERRDEGHDRWLAMQSAYAEYRRASEAFECTLQFADDSTASTRVRLTMLERQQRAFERYLDARMDFLEFQLDGRNRPGTGPAATPEQDPKEAGASSLSAFPNCLPVLQILALILLCAATFSLIREQKHLRDLEVTRNKPRAVLNQTQDGVQLYAQKTDNGTLPHSAIRNVGHTPPAPSLPKPAATPQAAELKPTAKGQRRRQPVLRVQPKKAGAKRQVVPVTQSRRIGTRNYYSFSLAPSRQFKRIGPIKVLLWSVDSQRKHVRLSIQSNSMQIDVARLQLNQPVWINVGSTEQPLELVVDRLAGNRLDGHLVEPRNNNAELSASRLLPANP